MNREKKIELEKAYNAFIDAMKLEFPVNRLDEFVIPDVMGYGTTIDERVFDYQGLLDIIEMQKQQSDSIQFNMTLTPVHRKITGDGNSAVYVDEVLVSMKLEEGLNEFTARVSTVLDHVDGKWKVIHWHGSKAVETEGDTWHKEEWKKKNEELQRLVDEKTADLKQKNRELEIEAALEKVRSRTMAMQHSNELPEAANVLFNEIRALGINAWSAGYNILSEDRRSSSCVMSSEGTLQAPFHLPFTGESSFMAWYEAIESNADFFIQELGGKEIKDHYEYLMSLPGIDKAIEGLEEAGIPFPTYQVNHLSFFSKGFLLFITYEPVPEAHSIFKRFTAVFEQTYTRFLDLKHAEEQAREAQLELALERIRARVTSMNESAELLDIMVMMRKEFVSLGHEAHYFWYMRYLSETYEKAMTSGDGTRIGMVMTLPRHIHGDIKLVADWENSDEPALVFPMDEETAVDYVHKMITLGDFKQVDPNAPTLDDIRALGGLTFVMARSNYGEIGFSLPGYVPDPPQEDLDTLVRFAGVFDLAYRRFEDLKNAEQRNRDTKIELALERVRARAMAMHKPEELKEVADVMRHEMGKLGVEELETSSIYINDKSLENAECWYAIKDVRDEKKTLVNDYFSLKLKDTEVGREMLKFYKSDDQQVSILMTGQPRIEWIRYCEERSAPLRGYYGKDIPDRIYHLFRFSHGAIGAATPGDISEESWGLLKRAASVFSLAYSRFRDLTQAQNDLKKLKIAKKRAEDALSELKATQAQLIHAEKMASLGELTAGIAHEIQNPLNFVNNFSELSTELIDEMKEELAAGSQQSAVEIAEDIKQNLGKILHHGKRADGIVKGMLQHSRTSSGQKELTDINELADEYLRLAYHGLRAKDKSFNADFKLEADEQMPEVNVVPQDIGRVLLNLINNAFHAVAERARTEKGDFKPTVTVTTARDKNGATIMVQDNGMGIPDNIREKIFQPFFTTKPSGAGTGLGLSLSYDIVKKGHGGDITIKSSEGKGTTVSVRLQLPQ